MWDKEVPAGQYKAEHLLSIEECNGIDDVTGVYDWVTWKAEVICWQSIMYFHPSFSFSLSRVFFPLHLHALVVIKW
jgi:hypothetical protein